MNSPPFPGGGSPVSPGGRVRRAEIPQEALDRITEVTGSLIADPEFRVLRDMIHDLAGIHLSSEKKVLLVSRLNKRLRALGLATFRQYIEYLRERDDGEERVRMIDCICTNETQFFREPQQFEYLERAVYPRWERAASLGERSRAIRVWSSACSTGEEPYSIAMSLLARFPPQSGWSVDILATDLSTSALERAIAGIWPLEKASEIPRTHLLRFMLKGSGRREGCMAAGPELRDVVRFRRFNLAGRDDIGEGQFDLIFCRNVIIYFDSQTKEGVVRGLLNHLAPSGYLLLGHAESLHGTDTRIRRHVPSVYSLGGYVGRAGGEP